MSRRTRTLALFLAACTLQLGVPAAMVLREETVLRRGAELRFRCGPVDSVGSFRGRSVTLSLDLERDPVPAGKGFREGQQVFVVLGEDEEGFARLDSVLTERPPEGSVYVKARLRGAPDGSFRLDLPFDRYYMKESRAPETERLLRESAARGGGEAWIVVRVHGGRAALADLVVEPMTAAGPR